MQAGVQTRPDMDIEDDINASLRDFSPLKAARFFFQVRSTNGNIKVRGNSGSPQAKRVLGEYIHRIRGVNNVDLSDLHDDESIRLKLGGMLPEGILVSVQFGSVVLISTLPDGNREILHKVRSLAGVRRVVMNHDGVEVN
jgi:hypothetical protein